MTGNVVEIMGGGTDPDRRIRLEWAASLHAHMGLRGLSRKQLRLELAKRNVDVSEQAIGCWLRGEKAPRPYHQAVIAGILSVPVRSLFPIEAVA